MNTRLSLACVALFAATTVCAQTSTGTAAASRPSGVGPSPQITLPRPPGVGPSPSVAAPRRSGVGPSPQLPGQAPTSGTVAAVGAVSAIPVAQPPPNATPSDVTPMSPGAQYKWVPGHYTWTGTTWQWTSGAWNVPPDPNAVWVPGNYNAAAQTWTEGHWELGSMPAQLPQ